MKKTFLLIFSVVLFASNVLAQNPPRRLMTIDDALNMVRVGSVLMSPDGKQVFYGKTELDWDKNKRKTTHYMVSADGGEPKQYIGEAGGDSFQFSPDGKYLSFLRKHQKYKQLFIMLTEGGEASRYTGHRGGISSYKWSGDGKRIFFSAEEILSEEEQKEHDLGADPIFIDEGPNGKKEGHWINLWALNIATREESRITKEELLFRSFDVSPDGERIILSARRDDRVNYPFLAELYLVEISSGEVTRLTDNMAPERNPLWAPDGKTLVYRAPSDADFHLTNGYFWIMNPDTGERRKLEGQDQGEVSQVTWMPDGKSILFNEVRRTNSNLYRMNVTTGEVTTLTDVTGTLKALAFSRDRQKMVYSFSDFTTPEDLYVSTAGGREPVRLTNANPWIEEEILMPEGSVIRWESKGGMEIEGVFYLPSNYRKDTRLPLMLFVHGGPSGYFGNEFRTDFHVYTGLGYAALGPNVRGSSAYGDEVLRGLIGEVGDGEFHDLMNGVDYVIEKGLVDPDRLGIRGWSWGGVSSGYTITQTDRFKAASVGAGVTNWAAEVGPGFSYDVGLWYIGGTPWDNPEEWAKRSSITYVKNVSTPTIFLHGGEDRTSSVNQSLMYFTALRDIGKAPVRYINFPRQGHGVREPRLWRILQSEEIKWMQKYVRGIEWEPPRR